MSFEQCHLVGGFKHSLFSRISGIILPIDEPIFFKMVIAPPTSHLKGLFSDNLSDDLAITPFVALGPMAKP